MYSHVAQFEPYRRNATNGTVRTFSHYHYFIQFNYTKLLFGVSCLSR